MRVALVTDWFHPRVGGIEVHVLGLARRLRQRGVEATVVTPWPGEAVVDDVPVERLPLRLVPGIGVSLAPWALAGALGRALTADRYDLIHGHVSFGSTAAIASAWAGWRAGIPVLGTFHSVFGPWLGGVFVASAPILRWRRWPFRVAAVSRAVAEDLRWIMPEREVELLPCAVDPGAWAQDRAVPEPGRLRLVTTSRLHPRKRLDALIRIVARVRARVAPSGVEVTLEILGEGPQRARLEGMVRELGLEGAVELRGAGGPDDVRALLRRGDVFVNACVLESFGIAALEALAAGLPVVARAGTGASSFVGDGFNGLLPGSDGDMEEALSALARDPVLLARLQAGAARGVPPEMTWDRLLDRHMELYRDLT